MNSNARSILELADHVVEKDLPLLFLDTCTLLDVIRAPLRCDVAEDATAMIAGAMRLVDRQDEFVSAVSSIVPEEFCANRSKVAGELTEYCRPLIKGMATINSISTTLGLQAPPPISDDSILEFESRLGGLADQLLANAFELEQEDTIKVKAFDRLAARIPPGYRGDQVKDCLIFEELIEFSRRARDKNYLGRIVFCTSNTKDYCESRSNAYPEITSELGSVNVTFTTKLSWAFAELNLS